MSFAISLASERPNVVEFALFAPAVVPVCPCLSLFVYLIASGHFAKFFLTRHFRHGCGLIEPRRILCQRFFPETQVSLPLKHDGFK